MNYYLFSQVFTVVYTISLRSLRLFALLVHTFTPPKYSSTHTFHIMSYNLPCPSLMGIFFVVSNHNGPHFVFHYPPELSNVTLQSAGAEESDEDFDDEDFDFEESIQEKESPNAWDVNHREYYLGTKKDITSFLDAQRHIRGQEKKKSSRPKVSNSKTSQSLLNSAPTSGDTSTVSAFSTSNEPTSKQILGFEPEHLCEMLCPPKDLCNKRFELTLERVVFLGLPIHVFSNGSWRSKKQKAKLNQEHQGNGYDSGSDDNDSKSSMHMFHMVFVMNPLEIERDYRIDEMFYYITSKIALVLRSEQLRHDYVWNQVRNISRLKEEWRTENQNDPLMTTLSNFLLSKSSLCKLMADCYEAISSSKVANLLINNKLRSFQIPIKLEFHSLPEMTVPFIPGSYLTSAVNQFGKTGLVSVGETTRYRANNLMNILLGGKSADGGDEFEDSNDSLDQEDKSNANDVIYFSLLLLDDPEAIIRDMKVEQQSGLATFVRLLRPVDSLVKMADRLSYASDSKSAISLGEVKLFALHLIYWRKARAIPPLNSRSIYIVSPMAPLTTNLQSDIAKFKRDFTAVPSLPVFLKLLSTRSKKPRQFASIIPSRDHKETYLMALGWLIRYGYVTQLHTYIWLKVSRKIKMRVEEDMENELGNGTKRIKDTEYKEPPASDNKVGNHVTVDNSSKKVESASQQKLSGSIDEEIDNIQRRFEWSGESPDIIMEDDEDTILVDPGRASSIERRWINRIIHDECHLSSELTSIFFKVLKYMNGRNSLELLLLKENISRTDLRKLLVAIEDHIISVRHW